MRAVLTDGEVLARFGHALSDPTRTRVLLSVDKRRVGAGRHRPADPAQLAPVYAGNRLIRQLDIDRTRTYQPLGGRQQVTR